MLTNNQEKLIRSLVLRKNRKKSGLFVAEGLKLVKDLMSAGLQVENIFVTDGPLEGYKGSAPSQTISLQEMKRISFLETPSPVLAIVKQPSSSAEFRKNTGLVLLLDRIQDPGNMGTLLRTALWYGVDHIALVKGSVDVYNPKVVQASMGALAHLQFAEKTAQEWVEWSTAHSRRLLVADMDGTPAAEMNWTAKDVLVLGNEGQGCDEVFKAAGDQVTLPGNAAKMESLNVAISGATLLYAYATASNEL
ncbi:MAG: RNA methyltransferase [Schleiferiaceae bacterium]|nr:RNA methyltransferase [Schleiferiaceae bacterium]